MALKSVFSIKLEYNKNAGVVSTGSGETISLDPDVYYGKNEQNISVYISTSTGYQMKSAIVKKDSETTGSELAVSGYNYSFDMPDWRYYWDVPPKCFLRLVVFVLCLVFHIPWPPNDHSQGVMPRSIPVRDSRTIACIRVQKTSVPAPEYNQQTS